MVDDDDYYQGNGKISAGCSNPSGVPCNFWPARKTASYAAPADLTQLNLIPAARCTPLT